MWILGTASVLGFGFWGLVPANIEGFLKILLLPSIGLLLFTQLLLLVSFIFGVGDISAFMSLLTLTTLAIICFLKFRPKIQLKGISSVFVIILLITCGFLSYVWFTQALALSADGYKTGGGGMYGDSALHAAYISRLTTGEFPPQNPLFAGKKLVYPLANDLLSATLRKAGLNFNLALTFPQIIFLVGFLVLFYKTCKKFTSNFGFLTALLFLFLGWGVGSFFFFNEWLRAGEAFSRFLTSDWTNNPQYNLHFHNILTGLILPERSFLPGLVLGLLMSLNFLEYFEKKNLRPLVLNGLILGALPFWHTHTFIFFAITSLIFFVWLLTREFKKTLINFLLMFLISLIIAIPFLLLFFSQHPLGNFFHFSFGWQNGKENIILFWFKNSYLVIPLAIWGWLIIDKGKKIFFVPAFIIFLIANGVIFQPWDWDNIKLLTWSFLFFVILAGITFVKLFKEKFFFKFLVILIVLSSISTGVLSVTLQLKNQYVIYDRWDIDLASWAKTNSGIDEVFIVEPVPNNPISGLAGRLVYVGYPGHLWVHGIDYNKRLIDNQRILDGDFTALNYLDLPIKYLVLSKNDLDFVSRKEFRQVYQNQKYVVYGF